MKHDIKKTIKKNDFLLLNILLIILKKKILKKNLYCKL